MRSRTKRAFIRMACCKNPLTYEIMTPQSVGVPDSTLVLGKHSGRHAPALCAASNSDINSIAANSTTSIGEFVVLADQIKHVRDHHLLELIRAKRVAAAQRIPPAHCRASSVAIAASRRSGKTVSDSAKTFPISLAENPESDQRAANC